MALIVETGSGLSNANSFASVADANAYFTARNNLTWDALDDLDDKEPALIKATDFMQQMYRMRWRGERYSQTQSLEWPRANVPKYYGEEREQSGYGYDVYLPIEIPVEVKNACIELALRVTTAPLAADLAPNAYAKAVSVGPLSIEYRSGAPVATVYRAVEAMLGPLLIGLSNSAKLVRT